ncbi:MAG: TonB-dependent receptor [Bacteroidia bacterium]|nr:TonB-dependent receptor [Bacteroidia bacterium]
MRKLIVILLAISQFFILYSKNIEPDKDNTPQDTLKVYYLDEVVVSSSVKETNQLKNLPTAVSVISPKQLSNSQIESLPDMSGAIPNFFIPSYGSKVSTPIYIRGIGARLGSQTVSLYVDNVPSFNPSAFDFEFQDIQRVEVLRGAQGTLYGRNAIGGIVNIYTLSPLSFQGTSLMLSGGNYGQFSVKGSNYSKLSDNFGLSVAAYYQKDNGYFVNKYSGKNVDASKNAGGKIKMEWEITPSFKALLFSNYDYVNGGAFPYMHKDSTAVNFNEPSSYKRHLITNGLSLQYLGNGFSLNSTTGYQFLKDDMKMDQDYTPLSVFSIRQQQTQHSVSQEITLKSENQSKYRWVIGAFGFYDNRTIDTPVAIKKDGIVGLQSVFDRLSQSPGVPVVMKYTTEQIDLPGVYKKPSSGLALFHQSTLNDLFGLNGLSATAGIRFDYEHAKIDYSTESKGADIEFRFKQAPPAVPGISVNGDTLMQGAFSKSFWQVLPKFALKYQPVETAFVYLSASKGYKTGGYNEQSFSKLLQNSLMESLMRNAMKKMPPRPGGGGAPAAPPTGDVKIPTLEEQLSYAPEISWTYELGGRFEFFERRLSTTFALFYTKVDNIQIIKLEDQGRSGRTITNAGKSESKGVELSMRYNPTDNFTLFAEYGFADAKFKNYQTEKIENGKTVQVDYSGNYIPFAPQHTFSIGASYVYNFKRGLFIDRLIANIQYTGAGKIYWTEDNSVYQPFYGLTNASLTVEKNSFALELWGKNIFDKKYNSFYFRASDMTGKENAYLQRGYPVRFGATVRYTINR